MTFDNDNFYAKPLSADHQARILEVTPHFLDDLLSAVKDRPDDLNVTVARAYERNNALTYDTVPGKRNDAYGNTWDDYVVQLTVRVVYGDESWNLMETVAERLNAFDREDRIAQKEKDVEDLKAKLAEAERLLTAAKDVK